MNKNNYAYIIMGAVLLLVIAVMVPKYIAGGETNSKFKISGDVEKVEVYHFHSTQQCYSCKTVGAYAEETINTYFSDELKSGKVVFASINIDLAENKEIVDKYEAKGSSLLIGIYYKDGSFTKEENVNVWYKISDKTAYMNYLKGVIEGKLSGE